MVFSKKQAKFSEVMPNELKERQSRKMPTQNEMSLASIVKFGIGPKRDGDIPSDLMPQSTTFK